MNCTNEGCNARFCASHLENHTSICSFEILPCEQNCSDSIMRREMDKHCIIVCPMRLVNCPFYPVGCQSSVPHCTIQQHRLDDLHSHLLYILQVIHKDASVEVLKKRAEQLEEIGFWRVLVEIPSIPPRPKARRRQYPGSWRADEHYDGGSGELSGDDLAKFYGLVLPRSRGFRDKQLPKRSWASSSTMVLGRGACLSGEFYPTSVAPLLGMPRRLKGFSSNWLQFRYCSRIYFLLALLVIAQRLLLSIRLPDEGETITSTRPGKFYNICPAQLVPNAWRSIACSMALWRVYKYSISLSEFRNFFSLNCNPKLDQDKNYNNPPRLYGDETKIFEEIFRSVEESGRFSLPVLLESKSFHRVFVSPGSKASRTAGDNLPSGEAPSSSSDVGESQNPHEQARPESLSRDDSIECLGSFKIELRRLLPHIPDLTLLRWTGGKVLDPILDHYLNVPSSNPSSESCSNLSLPVELESNDLKLVINYLQVLVPSNLMTLYAFPFSSMNLYTPHSLLSSSPVADLGLSSLLGDSLH
ncbi:TRAF-like superfamily protein [Actinidia rufa]|uniref:TRAF-like superfamily protein n=1 Tax=Actinidia rufa TaxID=165716 RepID=A0A7J0G0H8_9ERIC|nr:TRAF-like superfamily protein [Actinidia rufa]